MKESPGKIFGQNKDKKNENREERKFPLFWYVLNKNFTDYEIFVLNYL